MNLEETRLEIFRLGENDEDNFYSLTNITKNSKGLDAKKLAKTRPDKLDEALHEMGCILLLSHNDVTQIMMNEQIGEEELHETIFNLAKKEGIV